MRLTLSGVNRLGQLVGRFGSYRGFGRCGQMRLVLNLRPRFDYGLASHQVDMTEAGAVFGTSGGMELTRHTSGRREGGNAVVEQVGDGLRATFTLREGETAGVVLESKGGQPQALSPEDLQRLADGAIPVSGRLGYGQLARQPPSGLTPPATVKRELPESVCVSRRRIQGANSWAGLHGVPMQTYRRARPRRRTA